MVSETSRNRKETATVNLSILLQNNVSSAIVLMETPMVQPQNIDGQFKIAVSVSPHKHYIIATRNDFQTPPQ